MEFCPLSTAWGDIATWVSGIATTCAVVAALFIGVWTDRRIERRAARDRMRAADAMAAALHYELAQVWIEVAQLCAAQSGLGNGSAYRKWRQLQAGSEKLASPVLEIVSTAVGSFEAAVGGYVLMTLAGLFALRSRLTQTVQHHRFGPEEAASALEDLEFAAKELEPILRQTLHLIEPMAMRAEMGIPPGLGARGNTRVKN